VDQLWAEAVVRWKAGERLYLGHEMETEARKRQEAHNELAADDRVGLIDAYIRTLLPDTWGNLTKEQRAAWYQTGSRLGHDDMGLMHRRETVCALEVLVECLGMKTDDKTRYKTKEINQILRDMPGLEYIGRTREPVYGLQRRFKIIYDEDIQ
jgi:hypothetical protein